MAQVYPWKSSGMSLSLSNLAYRMIRMWFAGCQAWLAGRLAVQLRNTSVLTLSPSAKRQNKHPLEIQEHLHIALTFPMPAGCTLVPWSAGTAAVSIWGWHGRWTWASLGPSLGSRQFPHHLAGTSHPWLPSAEGSHLRPPQWLSASSKRSLPFWGWSLPGQSKNL